MISTILIAAAAYVGGCFSPAIGREIKAFIAKEKASVVTAVKSDASAVVKKL